MFSPRSFNQDKASPHDWPKNERKPSTTLAGPQRTWSEYQEAMSGHSVSAVQPKDLWRDYQWTARPLAGAKWLSADGANGAEGRYTGWKVRCQSGLVHRRYHQTYWVRGRLCRWGLLVQSVPDGYGIWKCRRRVRPFQWKLKEVRLFENDRCTQKELCPRVSGQNFSLCPQWVRKSHCFWAGQGLLRTVWFGFEKNAQLLAGIAGRDSDCIHKNAKTRSLDQAKRQKRIWTE